jgi:hypothetical protein
MTALTFGLTSFLCDYSVSQNKEKMFKDTLNMDDSRQRYFDRTFIFTGQGD